MRIPREESSDDNVINISSLLDDVHSYNLLFSDCYLYRGGT